MQKKHGVVEILSDTHMHETYRLVFFRIKSHMTWARPITKGVRASVSKPLRLCPSTMTSQAGEFKLRGGARLSLNYSIFKPLKWQVIEDAEM